MSLVSFLNNLIKKDGFELIDSNSKKYVIGKPSREKPISLKLLDQKLMQKLLLYPDLYFGEAYMDGSLVIQNGTITEFLDLAFNDGGERISENIIPTPSKKSCRWCEFKKTEHCSVGV